MMPKRYKSPGFTMVEVLVVTLIALVIFTVGFTAINTATSSQAISLANVRATENARLFMQSLAHDFQGTYPIQADPTGLTTGQAVAKKADIAYGATGPYTPITTDPITHQVLVGGITSNRTIQFFTRLDSSNTTDQLTAIRYYINNYGQLCRDLLHGIPSSYGGNVECDIPYSNMTFQDHAMFEDVYSITVDYFQLNSQTKGGTDEGLQPVPVGSESIATHLKVTLTLFDRTKLMDGTLAPTGVPITAMMKHSFVSYITIPSTFKI